MVLIIIIIILFVISAAAGSWQAAWLLSTGVLFVGLSNIASALSKSRTCQCNCHQSVAGAHTQAPHPAATTAQPGEQTETPTQTSSPTETNQHPAG